MTIHKEGYVSILIVLIIVTILNFCTFNFIAELFYLKIGILLFSVCFAGFIIRFFRFPNTKKVVDASKIIAPADGEVVVIEETQDDEYFKEKRIQVSIFMSANNVHINWIPVPGLVKYFKYHPGKFLLARLPKSSTLNERTTFVIESENKIEILVRQIAGYVARRIVAYPKQGDIVKQGEQLGFIKFGSRVDLFLPLGTKVDVKLNQEVKGGQTIIANL